jgi:hypothetical protein
VIGMPNPYAEISNTELERINGKLSINPSAPVKIGTIFLATDTILRSDFVGATSTVVTDGVRQYLEIKIPTSAASWNYFSGFDWINAVFTAGEDDNIISYQNIQNIPGVGDLEWRVWSIDNSLYAVGSENPDVGSSAGYDRVALSVEFTGCTNIL